MPLRPVFPALAADTAAAAALQSHAIVLDARDEATFGRGHLSGAGRMTLEEFQPRRAELPPRTTTVLVVHDDPARAFETATALGELSYPHVHWLDAPLASLPGGHSDHAPAERLWRPSPFLERMRSQLPAGRSLDLAAGSGRESVYLALAGWKAEAWDHDPVALTRASELAARNDVTICTRVVELERGPLPEYGAGWDVVMAFRYLHRPLFPWIEAAVAPGGVLVYETFMAGQEKHGRPKQRRFLLEQHELRNAFPSLIIEAYEEGDLEQPPVMARVLARKPLLPRRLTSGGA